MKRRLGYGGLMLLSLLALSAQSGEKSPFLPSALQHLSTTRMVADVSRLSGPEFRGRLTGTPADLESAHFVATRFATLGLRSLPSDPTWMMTTEVQATRIVGSPAPTLEMLSPASVQPIQGVVGIDYLPILDSPSVDVAAPLVFVGYGISDAKHGWNEYAGIDARNRIVVFFRGKPDSYAHPVTHADKVRAAREHGAAAFLTFTGPIMSPYEVRRGMGHAPLAFYNQMGQEQAFPGAWIHIDLAERLLSSTLSQMGQSLRETQQRLQTLAQKSFETDTQVHLKWDSAQELGTLHNVLGLFAGSDPSLAHETVIIGAHRDHFGQQAGLVFSGADDNASGTAVLLEAARLFEESGLKTKRSLLFVSFSGEEQGLLGSRLYVTQPPRPLSQTVAMINIDHAGVGNGRLTIGITGLDKSLAANAGEHAGLADTLDLFGFFPGGDHVPFKEAGVPTITVVSGGAHPQFHQPSDTPHTIHPEILERAVRYVVALAWQLAN